MAARGDFDVQGVRVHSYDPDGNPASAIDVVKSTVIESLRTVESTRQVAIRFAAQRLTQDAYLMLLEGQERASFEHPATRTVGDVLSGMQRARSIELLLELGALETRPMKVTSELLARAQQDPNASEPWVPYGLTVFGKALAAHILEELLPKDPALVQRMAEVLGPSAPEAT